MARSFWSPECGPARWEGAQLLGSVEAASKEAAREDGQLWHVPGPVVLFDSAWPGSEEEPDNHPPVELTPGRYDVRTVRGPGRPGAAEPRHRVLTGAAAPVPAIAPGRPDRGLPCGPWMWVPNSVLWQPKTTFRPTCYAACSGTRAPAARLPCCVGT
ncbi:MULTISPECIES: Imm21 family immunity protein [unclassified Streptomyces]|uniref:Imm21 family immunity protein n=1 Tax=unclassified Streptomyces TaxID=2593676 RepID=UPI00099CA3B6|nr:MULTISPECIES: Imm21 family immunity protein [unclassified Streptomyces]